MMMKQGGNRGQNMRQNPSNQGNKPNREEQQGRGRTLKSRSGREGGEFHRVTVRTKPRG